MRAVRSFEEFVEEGVAKKINIDNERAKSLVLEAERKFNSLQETIKRMSISDDNSNDYIEYCYDIIMFLIRANMFKRGYMSSGQGAHEAEVSFARKLGLNEAQVQFLDQLRYFRNGILYYGKRFDKEYAQKVLEFLDKVYPKLKDL